MSNQTFRGVLKGQTLVVLDHAAPLPDGTPMEVRALPSLEPGNAPASQPVRTVRNSLPVLLVPAGTPAIDPDAVRRFLEEEAF